MNRLERYSLHSGLKISEPFVNDCFFPIVHDKYITFNSESSVESKKYDYWQEVIDLIYDPLSKENIKIIQIGNKNSRQYEKVYSIRGLVDFNQESYIIKKSLLHFSAIDYHSQLASFNNTPLVSLHSHEPSSETLPQWGDSEKTSIEIARGEKNPSYNLNESPKSINKISPFEISEKILNILGINNDFNNFDLINIGENYHIPTVEIVPDFEPSPNFLPNTLINLRLDLHFHEKNLYLFSRGRQLGIITDKEIPEELLANMKGSILKVFVEANDNLSDRFLKNLKKFNVGYELFCRNEDELNKFRLKYIDETVNHFEKKSKKDLDNCEKICDNTLVKSSKILISNGKKYLSKAHWVIDQPHKGSPQQLIDTSDFWEDLDYYLIYNEDKKNAKGKTKRK